MVRIFPLAATFLLLASSAVAEDAAQLLKRVAETYRSATSLHIQSETFSILLSGSSQSLNNRQQTIAFQKPGKYLSISQSPGDSHQIASDGTTLWRVLPGRREFIQNPVEGDIYSIKGGGREAEMLLGRLKMMMISHQRVTENLSFSTLLPDETVEVNGTRFDCHVVFAKYTPSSAVSMSLSRTYWIDKKRLLILRDEGQSRGPRSPLEPFEKMENRLINRVLVASINEPLPDDLFQFKPPQNYLETTKFLDFGENSAIAMKNKPAPDFEGTALDGSTIQRSAFRGKTVLLDFWATWCRPCIEQMPALARLYQEAKDQGLILIGINRDESAEKASAYLKKEKFDWPNIFDGTQEIHRKFKAEAIPSVILIDPQGIIREYRIGSGKPNDDAIRTALRQLGFKLSD